MKEEQPRLFVQHVAVDGGYVDAVRSQRSDHRIHLVAGENEISGDGCLAATGGLKTDGYRHAHRPHRADLHAIFHDWITAWHGELIDAAVCLSFDADDLIKLCGVEIDGWRWHRGGCREWGLAPRRQGFPNNQSHPCGIAMASNVHVERSGRGAQQVIVNGGDLKAAFDHLEHHRIDFGLKQHEVAHDHGVSVHGLERNPASECQSRLDGDAIEGNGQIGTGETIAVHIARDRGLPSKRVIDLLPVDFLSGRDRRERGRKDRGHKPKFDTHLSVLRV